MTQILCVCEVTPITDRTRFLLEARGYCLIELTSIPAALALALENPPDILVVEKDLDGQGALVLIQAVKACMQKAHIPVLLLTTAEAILEIDWKVYPVDDILLQPLLSEEVIARIMLAESRMRRVFDNNPLSRLPGNTSIIKAITDIIQADRGYGVCYLDIDNFKPYNDRYGFSQGDDVILMVSRIIVNVVEELARYDNFVGHVGGDDFVFIVPEERVSHVCEKILENFRVVIKMFIDPDDLEAGCYIEKDRQGRDTCFDLLSLSIAVVPTSGGIFHHYGEITAVASQLKHHVKKLKGNNYLIERRKQHNSSTKEENIQNKQPR